MKLEEQIFEFFSAFPVKTHPKKTILFQPEEPVSTILFLKSGIVRSYAITSEGKELTLNLYKPNSFFPITLHLSGKLNPYYFETVADSIVYQVPAEKVIEFLKENSHVLFDLTKRISIGLEGFMVRSYFLLSSNSRQKVSAILVMLAKRFGLQKQNSITISFPLTHELLASLSGVTRETTTIELNKLEKENVIIREKKFITIINLDRLEEIATLYTDSTPLPYGF